MLADHQRVAVSRACELLGRRRGLILADEVGLGKSFVGAAVGARLQSDGYAIELIVPAALVAQWRETIASFGVTARVITHDGLSSDPRVPDPAERRLIIVDEAHAFRNPAIQRYDALARRSIGALMMLITATPICNSIGDLHAIVSLIAPDDRVIDCGVPSIALAFERRDREWIDIVIAELVIRRDREVLPASLHFGSLRREFVRHDIFSGGGDVGHIIESLRFPLIGGSALLHRFLWRRLESSEAALLESIRRQLRFYARALDSLSRGLLLQKRDYRRAFAQEEDREAFQQVLFWELWAPPSAGSIDPREIEDEVHRLETLRSIVEQSPHTKRQLLLDLCSSAHVPTLIFTSSVATARDIYAALRDRFRCGLATSRERERAAIVFDRFRSGQHDFLVATDMAAEGLNLQRAGIVIHYDLPWNPVKLDQRNGRAFRIGQKRPSVRAIYFVPDSDRTGILHILTSKNRERRRNLRSVGDSGRVPKSTTLRARLGREAAAVPMIAILERRGVRVPESIERGHKAGLERLIAAMATEYLDQERITGLFAALALDDPERCAVSPAGGVAPV
jgi:superfamily II DNA or RNA helicase